jgi:putative oxidoreductase
LAFFFFSLELPNSSELRKWLISSPRLGFGQWLRYFLGVIGVGSAIALFFPRQAFYGAVVLSVSLVGHIVTHASVLHHPASFLVFLLAVALLIAYLRRPSATE